jgi:hypothetical protein
MAITWTVDIVPNRKRHCVTFNFRETDVGVNETYSITVPYEPTVANMLAKVKAELKSEVLARRVIRDKVAAIKAAINPAQIEAFINS